MLFLFWFEWLLTRLAASGWEIGGGNEEVDTPACSV
jgi:hypothetical protein